MREVRLVEEWRREKEEGLRWLEQWTRDFPEDVAGWMGEVEEVIQGWPPVQGKGKGEEEEEGEGEVEGEGKGVEGRGWRERDVAWGLRSMREGVMQRVRVWVERVGGAEGAGGGGGGGGGWGGGPHPTRTHPHPPPPPLPLPAHLPLVNPLPLLLLLLLLSPLRLLLHAPCPAADPAHPRPLLPHRPRHFLHRTPPPCPPTSTR